MVDKRFYSIDLFRLIASLFIVFLHLEYFLGEGLEPSFLRISARWAVPFFFITSGFFIGKKVNNPNFNLDSIGRNILRLIKTILISNLIFILFNIYLGKPINRLGMLFSGSYYHLWFLTALVFGLICSWSFREIFTKKTRFIILTIIALASIFTDSYDIIFINEDLSFYLFRFLTGYLFIEIGIFIYQKQNELKKIISTKNLVFLIIIIFLAQFFEIILLNKYFNISLFQHQIIITTPIISVLIFSLAIRLDKAPKQISNLGKDHSLFIYLYHPILIFILNTIVIKMNLFAEKNQITLLIFPLIIFLPMLLFSILIKKYFNKLFKILNGEF
jgi:surface polysaccharide O-acyltransferase-like enzyme